MRKWDGAGYFSLTCLSALPVLSGPTFLADAGVRKKEPIDWLGNTSLAGLTLMLTGLFPASIRAGLSYALDHTHSFRPVDRWSASSGGFRFYRHVMPAPMFRLALFRIRAFTTGSLAAFFCGRPAVRIHVDADYLAAGHLAAFARL